MVMLRFWKIINMSLTSVFVFYCFCRDVIPLSYRLDHSSQYDVIYNLTSCWDFFLKNDPPPLIDDNDLSRPLSWPLSRPLSCLTSVNLGLLTIWTFNKNRSFKCANWALRRKSKLMLLFNVQINYPLGWKLQNSQKI